MDAGLKAVPEAGGIPSILAVFQAHPADAAVLEQVDALFMSMPECKDFASCEHCIRDYSLAYVCICAGMLCASESVDN